MNQTFRVQWCQTLTSSIQVYNGVKQGGWSCIRTLINICEQFALDYDISFNCTKSQLLVLKLDFLMFLLVAFMLMDNILKFLNVQCTLVNCEV